MEYYIVGITETTVLAVQQIRAEQTERLCSGDSKILLIDMLKSELQGKLQVEISKSGKFIFGSMAWFLLVMPVHDWLCTM